MKRVPASNSSPISRILVPIDAVQTKLSDLRPILQTACRLRASVALLHCYVAPPSFDFAAGDGALKELSLHRWRVRSRLYRLTNEARKLYPKCSCRCVTGTPVAQILRQSQGLFADLIAIPLPLDLVRWCWLPEQLVDELIRNLIARCCVYPPVRHALLNVTPAFWPTRPTKADLLTTDVEPKLHRLAIFEP
jgi:hypothetical protein